MKVAAYQAPYLDVGSKDAVGLIREQIDVCESLGVQVLCCPEGILGGLADYASDPAAIAINVENGELDTVVASLASDMVATILGFTETDRSGRLYNSAVVLYKGTVIGLHRKLHPAIRRSVYTAGDHLPVFHIDGLTFGILICNDSNFPEHGAALAALGANAVFVPSNNGLTPEHSDVTEDARKADLALAAHGLFVIRSDVTGRSGGRVSHGTTTITAPNGTVLQVAPQWFVGTITADIASMTRGSVQTG